MTRKRLDIQLCTMPPLSILEDDEISVFYKLKLVVRKKAIVNIYKIDFIIKYLRCNIVRVHKRRDNTASHLVVIGFT